MSFGKKILFLVVLGSFWLACAAIKSPNVTSANPIKAYRQKAFRLLSFNIRYNNPSDGENAWDKRKDRVAGLIRFHQADLVGLQEALTDQIADLALRLPGYQWLGVGRDDGAQQGEYAAIFYRTERFKLLQQDHFWLSETPEVKGSKGWDAACVRIVTWAQFKDRKTGKKFFLFNTHFDHIGEIARIRSTELLLSSIERLAGTNPVLVTGDFNATATSQVYQLLTQGTATRAQNFKLADAFACAYYKHYGPDWTFHGFDAEIERPKIDFIFVTEQIMVIRHGFLTDQWDNRYPSDHLPVLAEVCLK